MEKIDNSSSLLTKKLLAVVIEHSDLHDLSQYSLMSGDACFQAFNKKIGIFLENKIGLEKLDFRNVDFWWDSKGRKIMENIINV
ncbi:MAG TPA: hypothetical protein ENJ53_05690 [Phaeodactylibacter sp.]|nr:hypothetical protein [Phaeodactylibacter sp.]